MGMRRPQLAEDVSTALESTSVTVDTSVKLAQASNCVPAPLRVQSSRLVATEGATPSPNTPEQSESLLANRLGHTLEPAFDFEQQVTVWNRRCPGRLTLRGFEPDLYRIKPEWVSLPTDGKRSFQGLKTFFEGKHWRVRLDIARPLSLDFGCVCAGEPRHKRKQALPFSLSRAIIQLHRQKGGGHPETQSLSLIELYGLPPPIHVERGGQLALRLRPCIILGGA